MNYIAILVNDLEVFEYVVKNITLDKSKYKFILFTDTRIGDKTRTIKKLAESNNLNFRLFTDAEVNNKLVKIVNTPFVFEYSMSLNILILWFCIKHCRNIDKLLILDDDVLINGDISMLFDDKPKFMRDSLAAANLIHGIKCGNKKSIDLYNEFNRIFDMSVEPHFLYKNYMNGGIKYYVRMYINIDLYELYLKRFFESNVIYEVWKNRRSYKTFFLDERFEQMLAIKFKMYNHDMDKYSMLVNQKFEKIDFRKFETTKKKLLHICNNQWKMQTFEKLVEMGVIDDV